MDKGICQKFLGKFKGKKIFRHMFAVCFGLAAICIFLSCIVGFLWFRASQLEKEEQDYENMLYAYSLMLDSYRNSAEETIEVLENDNYVKRIMYRQEFIWDDNTGVAASMVTNMISVNPFFHSIYIFGSGDYLLKSSNPSYPMDKQGDSLMQGIYQNSVFGEFTPAYYIDVYGESKALLCLSSGELEPVNGKKESGILVSLDIGRVMEGIFSQAKEGEQYLLTDGQGNIIYAKGGRYQSSNPLQEEALISLLRSCTGQSAELLRLDGERYLASCVNMDGEFYLVWLVPYQNLSASIRHVGIIFAAIGILVVIIVLLLAFAMSNRVYAPLDEMVRTAGEEGVPSKAMSKRLADTELSTIARTYQSMVQTLNHMNLRKEQEELAAYLSSKSTQKSTPEWVEETYGREGVHSRLVCLRISDTKDFHDNNTEEAIAFELETIKSIVEEVLKGLGDILVTPVDREYLAVMLFSESARTEEQIISGIREVFAVTGELLHIGMDAGISKEKEGFGELNIMYQMARAATAYRFMYGIGSIVTEEEMTVRALNGKTSPEVSALIEQLKNGDREGFAREYQRMSQEIKDLSIQAAMDTLMEMASQMITYYHTLHYRFEPLSKADYEALSQSLSSYEYMDDIGEWFFQLAEEIWTVLERSRQTGREDIVEKAVSYLQENYADPGISAQLLADRYHITPSYFSRLFHEKCGCAFPDYLTALRMEKAKELLLSEGNKSIQEICELVGYSNPSYFNAIFKKKFGVTPGQFRRNHRNGQ